MAPAGRKAYARTAVLLSAAAGGFDSPAAISMLCPCRLMAVPDWKLSLTRPSALANSLAEVSRPPSSVKLSVLLSILTVNTCGTACEVTLRSSRVISPGA